MSRAPARRPGTVVWAHLSTHEVQRATTFYEDVLGWSFHRSDTEHGAYLVARIDAGEVGGVMSPAPGATSEEATAGGSPAWTVFVGTDDLDATLAEARQLGGSVLQRAAPAPGGGRVAVVADPTGAAIGVIESASVEPGIVWGERGAVTWVECLSRDPATSRRFHETLFRWTAEEGSRGYVVFTVEGERVGGLMATPLSMPPHAPSYWLTYFAVADVAETAAGVPEARGVVLEPVHDIEEGRFAVLEDPSGAVFAVFETRD